MNSHLKKYWPLYLAGLLVVLIQSLVYWQLNIVPFGEVTLLTTDLKGQYISFFAYFKNALTGPESLIYSFSKTFAGNMVGLTTYYLLSPLNLIFLAFDLVDFPLAVTLLTLVKMAGLAISMAWLARFFQAPKFGQVLAGLAYAGSAYVAVYQQNIMWLDTLILVPLVIGGLELLMAGHKPWLYLVSLWLVILNSFYMGYMVCLFSLLYFTCSLLTTWFSKKRHQQMVASECRRVIVTYLMSSIAAGLLAGITLIPAILSLNGGKASFQASQLLNFWLLFDPRDLPGQFLPQAYQLGDIKDGGPNIYVFTGMLSLALLGLFNQALARTDKLRFSLMGLFLLVSLALTNLSLIWHGFTPPTWFPHRFSYLLVIIIILLACLQLRHWQVRAGHLLLTSVIVLAIPGMAYLAGWGISHERLCFYWISQGLFLMLLLARIILVNPRQRFILASLILLVASLEIAVNSHASQSQIEYLEQEKYLATIQNYHPAMQALAPSQDDFYRVERDDHFSQNDPLLLNYPGLSHYSSNEQESNLAFMSQLGYTRTRNWAAYMAGSSLAADSFMGRRYLLTINDPASRPLEGLKKSAWPQSQDSLLENPYAFPLAFLAAQSGDNIDLSRVDSNQNQLTPENIWPWQNYLFALTTGHANYYQDLASDDLVYEMDNLTVTDQQGTKLYQKINPDRPASLTIHFPTLAGDQLNYRLLGETGQVWQVFHNGHLALTKTKNMNQVTQTLAVSEQTPAYLTLVPEDEQFQLADIQLASSTTNQLAKMAAYAKSHQLILNELGPTTIKGQLKAGDQPGDLVVTIPYDRGWQAQLDGQDLTAYAYAGHLQAFKVPKQNGHLTMTYRPPGLRLGLVVSLIGLGITAGLFRWTKSKQLS
ncbi:hypothetical protein AWM75_00570 [Aerococcus urinaehominis]|uniref:Uncharacterized protein n=1 Tax=Aerococcus urinaehominis TaxID=128944 RepID=A0A120IAN0_9LACT|nr:YfhO family protein [Aerococcus urinaehominis]AMB98576.1 hypothetical protein AWM75_00570 [Aerococcus urinaehominis]SDL77348.1 Uncharacterized membrane protein YfhO [Aerococcus urinaehominis]